MTEGFEYKAIFELVKTYLPSWLVPSSRNYCDRQNSGINLNRLDGGLESIIQTSKLPKIRILTIDYPTMELSIEDPDFESKFKKIINDYMKSR